LPSRRWISRRILVHWEQGVVSLRIQHSSSYFQMPKKQGEVIQMEGKCQVSPISAWSRCGLKFSLPVCLLTANIISTGLLTLMGICTLQQAHLKAHSCITCYCRYSILLISPDIKHFLYWDDGRCWMNPFARGFCAFLVVFCCIQKYPVSWLG